MNQAPETSAIDTRLTVPVLGALCLLSLLWGASFFFVEIALRSFPPLTIAALRVSLALAALVIYAAATGRTLAIPAKLWTGFLILGALNNAIPFALIAWAQQEITGGLASIFNATTPLWAIIVSHWALSDERLSAGRLAGVLAGIVGVAILIGPAAFNGINTANLALLAMLVATFCYACAGAWARRLGPFTPTQLAAGQLAGSSALLLPTALVIEQPFRDIMSSSWEPIAAIVVMAIASTAVAYILYFRILKKAGATNVLLVTFLVPVTAILLGMTFLNETLLPRHIAGMIAIGFGLLLVDGRAIAMFRKQPA